jgi:hypothetical protein
MAGRKIDDHGSWMGKGSEYPLPMGSKMKRVESAEGAGSLSKYEDTNEEIVKTQKAGDSKIKGRPLKDGYRY